MNSELIFVHGLFWAIFGGCLLALFTYDFFYLLVDLLPDFFQVIFAWIISKRSKKS